MNRLLSYASAANKALAAVKSHADNMLRYGRDRYGKESPLFVGQLNVTTRRIPQGTIEDPGVYAGNVEVEGSSFNCQNLLFDLGLLDTLKSLSLVLNNPVYESASKDYLEYFFANCIHPESAYIPWGEHVGYDIVKDCIKYGRVKGFHEVKDNMIPWDEFWEVSQAAVRHEIETAFRNHICDEKALTLNRHAEMDGRSNLGTVPCSLANSAGTYIYAWVWLYLKTGETKFLEWACAMEDTYWGKSSDASGLFGTDETRPEELWYADVITYGVYLLAASALLQSEGEIFRQHGLSYFNAYHQFAFCEEKQRFYDTINIHDGKPVIGMSGYAPLHSTEDFRRLFIRNEFLEAWDSPINSTKIVHIAASSAAAYTYVQDQSLLKLFDKSIGLLKIDEHVKQGKRMLSGDAAAVILGLVHIYKRTERDEYMRLAAVLVEHTLKYNYQNGMFTSGLPGGENYYCTRAGSDDLASAALAFWMVQSGSEWPLPPIRELCGTMPW